MNGKFIQASQVEWEQLDWGQLGWISRPVFTGARHVTVIEVILKPGFGHNFHMHPVQEEVIYVVSGEIEQWLEENKRVLSAGDAVFIAAGVVHASFNEGGEPARLMVTLGPCVGEDGYVSVVVGDQIPWNRLR